MKCVLEMVCAHFDWYLQQKICFVNSFLRIFHKIFFFRIKKKPLKDKVVRTKKNCSTPKKIIIYLFIFERIRLLLRRCLSNPKEEVTKNEVVKNKGRRFIFRFLGRQFKLFLPPFIWINWGRS